MASSKEMQQTSRPLPHRPSISSSYSAMGGISAARQTHTRNNSHSIMSSSLGTSHRISRRKSLSSNMTTAVAAALREVGSTPVPIAISARRMSKGAGSGGLPRPAVAAGSLPSPPASLPTHMVTSGDGKGETAESAIDDEFNEISGDDVDDPQKARLRRASDGQPLAKDGRKSNRPELRCEKCGKGYKHSSCLTKHLWEHTPEWSYTSKLLISKHQQVQLLEAASVLVAMNTGSDAATPPDSARDFSSDRDSASPAASGYSGRMDRSSVDTTPPPQSAELNDSDDQAFSKPWYSSSHNFSRSYQSAPFAKSIDGSVPAGSGFGHIRQSSQDQRPVSSGKNATGQDDRDLAAAVELLSCSFNSNGGSRTVHLPADAPPVPPLPAQYLDQAALTGTSFINSFTNRAPESFTRGDFGGMDKRGHHQATDDMKMDSDKDDDMVSWGDEDGVFGRMEE